MNNLEKRLDALEATSPGRGETLVWVVSIVPSGKPLGRLIGFKTAGGYVKRQARESEEAVLERALALAEQHRPPGCWALSVFEDRAPGEASRQKARSADRSSL